MISLRPYQQRCVDSVRLSAKNGNRHILMVLPTAGGKTIIMADIVKNALSMGNKVLSLMHRRGLVDQMIERFSECGIESGCIMAGIDDALERQCQVASLWTYSRRIKLAEKQYNSFWVDAPLILIDEAHHVLSRTYQKVLSEYPNAFVIGCTATPTLSTGAGLGRYFDDLVNVVSMKELLDGGYLVPGEYYGPSEPDLRKVPTLMGDWTKSGLDKEVNKGKIIGNVVDNWLDVGRALPTMVFAVNRKHAKALCHEYENRGVTAEYLDAFNTDDQRDNVLRRLKDGTTQVVCQVALYTEGTDIPELRCLVIARPTKSLGLHRQILGRGARPDRDKDSFIVLDHGGNVRRLGYYEDEIDWTLSDKELSNKPKKPRKKEKHIITCDMCKSLVVGKRCSVCGHEIKSFGKKIEEVEASLQPLNKGKKKVFTMDEKRLWFGMLEYKRREKGYQPGWTAHKYREKIGCWPRGMDDIGPIEPNQEFKNWMKHLAIKYHKSKQKQEQADAG